jgi:purine-nucleoside/S-methyl-5'-thioadenosine phosphorylase / adenosine deaminase
MTEQIKNPWLWASWPAPKHIRAGTSIRVGGNSQSPYNDLNLALHVGDKPEHVIENRDIISRYLNLPSKPIYLEQTHSSNIISVDVIPDILNADGSHTTEQNRVCTIMTADCVPILLCDTVGTKIAAIHAGWKGICNGIIEKTVNEFQNPNDILVWIGPCISRQYYEVGKDVYERCLRHSMSLKSAFNQSNEDHWFCDLIHLVKIILKKSQVGLIHECGLCTYKMDNLFYSYRRDGITGRTASMIWME